MIIDCLYCGKRHDTSIRCSSVASACSGEDARLADKASVGRDLVDRLKRFVDSLEDPIAEAAVSPRSGDGLLPCQFCGEYPEEYVIGSYHGFVGTGMVRCKMSMCALYEKPIYKKCWQKRASGSVEK